MKNQQRKEALGLFALLSDDMTEFVERAKEIKILDENGKVILAGDNDRRFLKLHGCINIMDITFRIQPAIHI
jgi:hypothetical protein